MSSGVEQSLNMKLYSESSETYRTLKKGNLGWTFLIDDILAFGVPDTGNVLAIVRGQYQVNFDNIKADLPPRLWGYRELSFVLVQDFPKKDTKTQEFKNKWGWSVMWSTSRTLNPSEKDKLTEKNSEFYVQEELLKTK